MGPKAVFVVGFCFQTSFLFYDLSSLLGTFTLRLPVTQFLSPLLPRNISVYLGMSLQEVTPVHGSSPDHWEDGVFSSFGPT